MRKLVDFPWWGVLLGELVMIGFVLGGAYLASKVDGAKIPGWGIYVLVLIAILMWSRPSTKEINRAIGDSTDPQKE